MSDNKNQLEYMATNKNSKASKKPDSKIKGDILEQIVAMMYLAPGIKVETKVELSPTEGGGTREIDVLLTLPIAENVNTKVAIECKNYKEIIDVPYIDSFVGKLDDVGIPPDHGIFVSINGFTSGAIRRAKKADIKLLTLTGLTPDRLASEISKAFNAEIYLLLNIESFEISNNFILPENSAEMIVFRNDAGDEFALIDLMWLEWLNGKPSTYIGRYKHKVEIPESWHCFINGQEIQTFSGSFTVRVVGLVATIEGTAIHHQLKNASDSTINRVTTQTNFTYPDSEVNLVAFSTENELKEHLITDASFSVIKRIKLPRILFMQSYYWPPSERVVDYISSSGEIDIETGKINRDSQAKLDFRSVEGPYINTNFEPIWKGHAFSHYLKREKQSSDTQKSVVEDIQPSEKP